MPEKRFTFTLAMSLACLGSDTGRGARPKFNTVWLSFACTAEFSHVRLRTQVHFTPLRVVQARLSALMKNMVTLDVVKYNK